MRKQRGHGNQEPALGADVTSVVRHEERGLARAPTKKNRPAISGEPIFSLIVSCVLAIAFVINELGCC